MKTAFQLVCALAALRVTVAQSLEPSPTESVGCEAHEDHWHCDGPRTTSMTVTGTAAAVSATTTVVEEDHDHDAEEHDHSEEGSASLAPSPTESYGCEAHIDHWHCDGPITSSSAAAAAAAAATTSAEESYTDEAGTATPPPSPTASYGCEPHGDHWHCDGARTASMTMTTNTETATAGGAESTETPEVEPSDGGAEDLVMGYAMGIAGFVAAVAGAV